VILALEPHEVHAWFRVTEPPAGAAPTGEDCILSIDECARRDRFRFDADRRDYALAHDLLRRSLSRYQETPPAAWRFETGENGKPFLSGGELSFNLSHTRGLVACGIARALPVGIDVERIDRPVDVEQLAARFFSPSETASLRSGRVDARVRFFDLWTLKEAFIKAIGAGLSQPLNSFSFDLDRDERRVTFSAPRGFDATEWQFALYAPLSDARLAIAAQGTRACTVRWRAYDAQPNGFTLIDPIRTSHRRA